jgi:hypothetical protein
MLEAMLRAGWFHILDAACHAEKPVPKVAHKLTAKRVRK